MKKISSILFLTIFLLSFFIPKEDIFAFTSILNSNFDGQNGIMTNRNLDIEANYSLFSSGRNTVFNVVRSCKGTYPNCDTQVFHSTSPNYWLQTNDYPYYMGPNTLGSGDYFTIACTVSDYSGDCGVSNYIWNGSQFVDYYVPPVMDSITAIYPQDEETSVNSYVNFTGVYTNLGDYDTVVILLDDLTHLEAPLTVMMCDLASIGEDLNYSCSYSGQVNTHYSYNAILWDSSQSFPDGTLDGMNATPWDFYTGDFFFPPELPSPVPLTCNTFDIACYLKQAMSWAFIPSSESLEQFSDLSLADRIPFSYVYDIGNVYDELFVNTGSEEFAVSANTPIGTINFISKSQIEAVPFASTIKTILAGLLYLFTIMTIYRRILSVHN